MKKRNAILGRLLCACLMIFGANEMAAQTAPIKFGVRLGVNTANQGINISDVFANVKKGNTEWRAGYELGVVADIPLGSIIALQPGFFFQSRGYNYVVTSADMVGGSLGALKTAFGSARYSNFQIPMLVSVRIPVMKNVQWQIDAGPYISLGLGGHNEIESYTSKVTDGQPTATYLKYEKGFYDGSDGEIIGNKKFDWGIKFGTGLKLHDHYYIGVHYNAGCKNVGKNYDTFINAPKVKNKSWDFSIGYDF